MSRLDLHGCNYKEVESKTIRFIEEYWDKNIELEIITGNSSSMKNTVINLLNEYKLEYRIGDLLEVNKGFIVVLNN